MHAIPLREDETYYPDSDGEPVAESPVHLEEMIYASGATTPQGIAFAVEEEHVGPHEDVGVVLKPLVQDFPLQRKLKIRRR